MRILVNYFLVMLMAIHLFSCTSGQKRNKETLKIEWRPGINAPRYYPITPVFGSFSAEGKMCGIATGGRRSGGWGLGGMEMSTGHFVPDRLEIGWFSYAEDKFFRGDFKLPADTIRALFKQGYVDKNGKKFGYDGLIVNVYPKGGVALWMYVSGTRTVEIGHFQGEEMDYDWKSMFPDMTDTRSEFNTFVLGSIDGANEYIAQYGINPEPFKSVYRQRYNYTIEIDSVSHEDIVFVQVDFYNGEMDVMEGKELDDNFFKTKAVPNYIYFRWIKDGVVYFGEVYLQGAYEMFKVFEEMHKDCPDEPYVLYLKPDFTTRKLTASLQSQTKEIEIKQFGKIGKSANQRAVKQ